MLKIRYQAAFKKDYKRLKRRGYDMTNLEHVVSFLAGGFNDDTFRKRYSDHALKGDYAGCRECHITPDWLLIYEIHKSELILYLMRTGTHSDLFEN